MIVDITGSISIYHEFGPAALASIEVDDLRYLGRLDLDQKSWNVELMSMGKLGDVGHVTIRVNKESRFRFPELGSAGLLSLKRNVSALFPKARIWPHQHGVERHVSSFAIVWESVHVGERLGSINA
ncbi:hypothetical protein EYC84_009627 [Monilinia fructicola]|uniref:Uncharacterized protein n=1 Tax=Monilinia fructicola TaxID=38448 RepID=A0A5M9JBQ3_MONFR|nr:hypothetical protein EYC84_009627 [Monilinia fructicola]